MTDRTTPEGDGYRAEEPGADNADADGLALFADDAFQEYDEQPLISLPPRRAEPEATPAAAPESSFAAAVPPTVDPALRTVPSDGGASPFGAPLLPRRTAGSTTDSGTTGPSTPGSNTPGARGPRSTMLPRVLLWVAIGLVAVLALIALFMLGHRLGTPEPIAAPAPSDTPAPEPEPEPEPEPPTGPAEPGVHAWSELRGGECLDPYTNPWAEEFTVVDCALPHPAQVLLRAPFPGTEESTPFPTAAALQSQINVLCSAPSVIDLAVAGAYADIQIDGSYAITAEQWDDGLRDYTCFVSRSSGEPIAENLVVTG